MSIQTLYARLGLAGYHGISKIRIAAAVSTVAVNFAILARIVVVEQCLGISGAVTRQLILVKLDFARVRLDSRSAILFRWFILAVDLTPLCATIHDRLASICISLTLSQLQITHMGLRALLLSTVAERAPGR